MEVHPEIVVQSWNVVYSHLQIFTTSARALGLNNSSRRILDWLNVLLVAISFAWGSIFTVVHINELCSESTATLHLIVESIQLLGGFFLVIVCSLNSFHVNKSLQVVLAEMNHMDIQLSTAVPRPVRYRTRAYGVLQLACYTTFLLGVLSVHVLAEKKIIHLPLLYFIIRFYPTLCIGILVLLFFNILVEVKLRLRGLNGLLEKYCSSQMVMPMRQLHVLGVVYESSFEVCLRLNATFSTCNMCQIGYCFISITAKIFFIFTTLTNLDEATFSDLSKNIKHM